MSASLVLDGRCRTLRRRLGPVPWMILEEAALSAKTAESPDSLWTPLSVRRVADSLGMGRDAAARGLATLVSEGVLRRSGNRRGAAGRFVPAGYWLMAPAGLAVSGVVEQAVSGDSDPAGPCPVVPAAVPATVVDDGQMRTKELRRGGGRRSHSEPVAAGQASLFAAGAEEKGAKEVAASSTPRVGAESVGAVSSDGCEVVNGVHELAPGVRAGADPSLDPHPATGGSAGC